MAGSAAFKGAASRSRPLQYPATSYLAAGGALLPSPFMWPSHCGAVRCQMAEACCRLYCGTAYLSMQRSQTTGNWMRCLPSRRMYQCRGSPPAAPRTCTTPRQMAPSATAPHATAPHCPSRQTMCGYRCGACGQQSLVCLALLQCTHRRLCCSCRPGSRYMSQSLMYKFSHRPCFRAIHPPTHCGHSLTSVGNLTTAAVCFALLNLMLIKLWEHPQHLITSGILRLHHILTGCVSLLIHLQRLFQLISELLLTAPPLEAEWRSLFRRTAEQLLRLGQPGEEKDL